MSDIETERLKDAVIDAALQLGPEDIVFGRVERDLQKALKNLRAHLSKAAPDADKRAMQCLRKPMCWMGMCPCRPYEDDGGCGGKCIHCGEVFGYVTREQLRRYAESTLNRP